MAVLNLLEVSASRKLVLNLRFGSKVVVHVRDWECVCSLY